MADGPTGLGSERTYDGPPSTSSGLTGPLTTRHCPKPSRSQTRSTDAPSRNWHQQIVARHHVDISNGSTESADDLVKRIKRVAFGFATIEPTSLSTQENQPKPAHQLLLPLKFEGPQRAPKPGVYRRSGRSKRFSGSGGGLRYTPVHTLLA